ncbi:hypothetical protein [Nocardia terpenica]|uniref:Uncharacterized protein n=1 Tax=Nocardia terpenica TaxID=455432 RepID=A0A6G9Z2Y1_9NOCA|nr:hypothetical protein [Nocardia terpenica]QIS19546.1 hypothetical protein F6W96_15905 [Nocardia terpenica]
MTATTDLPLLTRLAAAGRGFRLAPPPGSLTTLIPHGECSDGWTLTDSYAQFPGVLECEVHPPTLDNGFVANAIRTSFVFDELDGAEEILDTATDLEDLGSTDVVHQPITRLVDNVLKTSYFGTYPHGGRTLYCWTDYYLVATGTGGHLLQHTKTATETQWPTVESDFTQMTARFERIIAEAVSRDEKPA